MRFAISSPLSTIASTFALVLVVVTLATAQEVVPGFRGKRFFVEPTVSFFPSFIGPSLYTTNLYKNNGNTNSGPPTTLSFRGGVALHYITGRKANMLLRYEFFPVGMDLTTATPLPPNFNNQYGEIDRHSLFFELDTHVFSFGMEFSAKSMLAPVGPYTRLTLQYMMYNAIIKDKQTYYTSYTDRSQTQHLPIGLDNISGTDFGLGLDFGYRSVIAKKILFNWALCTNFSSAVFAPSYGASSATNFVPYNDANKYLEQNLLIAQSTARSRISNHWLMLNVSVAYPF